MPGSHYCKFVGCKNNSANKDIRFFRFPKDENRSSLWRDACRNPRLDGIPSTKLHTNSFLCQVHFKEWCFMNPTHRNRLVHNAVPNSPKIFSEPFSGHLVEPLVDKQRILDEVTVAKGQKECQESNFDGIENSAMVVCCVPFCTSNSNNIKYKGIGFHDFPLDPSLKQRWLIAISRKNFTPNTNSFTQGVCSKHFQDADYKTGLKRRCLKPNSVPSIFPGYPPGYPSCKVPKLLPSRKLPKRDILNSTQPKVEVNDPVYQESSSGAIPEESDCSTQGKSLKLSTPSDFLENVTHVTTHSQTTWNIDKYISQLKHQKSCLRSKNLRLEEKLKKLQAQLDKAQAKLQTYEQCVLILKSSVVRNE